MGWPGGWSDPAPGGTADRSIPLSSAVGDELFLMELDEALGEIRAQTGIEQFEMIGLDACLMGHLEVFDALAPHARYAVASQETEPALGWAYTGFLEELRQNPDMDGAELSRLIVDSYIQDDQRIVDDQARAELLKQGSPMGGLFGLLAATAAQVAQQMEQSSTLTAVDLAAIPQLMDSVNESILQPAGGEPAGCGPGADLCPVVHQRLWPGGAALLHRPGQLCPVAQEGKRRQRCSPGGRPGAGLTGARRSSPRSMAPRSRAPPASRSTFPTPSSTARPSQGPNPIRPSRAALPSESLWDDFLAYHYTGRTFERATGTVAVPERGATVTAPGAGQIEVSPISLSGRCGRPGPAGAPEHGHQRRKHRLRLALCRLLRPGIELYLCRRHGLPGERRHPRDRRRLLPGLGRGRRVHHGVRVGAPRVCHQRRRGLGGGAVHTAELWRLL